MQIKINFLCRDSILAAPIVLDLALFLDLAKRANMTRHTGVAVASTSSRRRPHPACGRSTTSSSSSSLQNTLRHLMGEDLITHLGLDYYQELVESLS